ncbi:MAG: phosphoglycerate mutase (2,3-diphosphoglycerate-independent) [Rhodospirillaceae bacterium]|nr:phosphoglycerate mutase (2,3-diphosphoglycerate-independent) [Rhodospirillaceae bacterium]
MDTVVLCIMDGWGDREADDHNAVALADTPVFDRLRRRFPASHMSTSGCDVGLPDGQMGNSEVGHINLGAGRVVIQGLPRIDQAIADGSLAADYRLASFIEDMCDVGGCCHLAGLLSPGGVHSHENHVLALARTIAEAGVPVLVHAVLDGRDTPPKSALESLAKFENMNVPGISIATVIGRYFAMDRDKRWERVEIAYRAWVLAEGCQYGFASDAVRAAYERGVTDEFIEPAIIDGYRGVKDGDGLLFANFRADRAREILGALLEPEFDAFIRPVVPAFSTRLGMVSYSSSLDRHLETLFPSDDLKKTIGEVVAEAGHRQLRIAETEKYPHVTFFLNGGREVEYQGEERILVPSPRVKTYDLKPEMSAYEVADRLVDAILSQRFGLIVANFANPDMVGHTGDLAAAIKAVETVDHCIGRVSDALEEVGGAMLLTSDHGNCETMVDPQTGGPHTAHTTNMVPSILVNAPDSVLGLKQGILADVAPTLLTLMGLPVPDAMEGRSLLIHQLDSTSGEFRAPV